MDIALLKFKKKSPKYLLVVELYNKGLPVREIAKKLGIGIGTVYKHLRYAESIGIKVRWRRKR